MAQKIGIYPGTFDPIHEGHIAFAEQSQRIMGLDAVIFLPEKRPRGKAQVTPLDIRLAQLYNALEAFPSMYSTVLESSPFTIQHTLPELHARFSGAELTLLIGSDVAKTLSYRWEDLGILFATTALAVGMRKDDSLQDIQQLFQSLEKEYDLPIKYVLIQTPFAHIASSQRR